MKADSFNIFTSKILAFPLWVKQILYFYLRSDLKTIFTNQSVNIPKSDLFQTFIPTITFVGKKEISERLHNHEETMYTFLKAVSEKKSIIDITLDCFLTLEEVSKLYITSVKNEYILESDSKVITATAEFFSGQIKTGEYLMKIGRLTVDQLDIAIRKQKKMLEEGKKCYMAEILSGLGFIEKDEIVSILIMKEESKRRFIFNMELNSTETSSSDIIELKKQVERLNYENNYLKTKLKAILKMGT